MTHLTRLAATLLCVCATGALAQESTTPALPTGEVVQPTPYIKGEYGAWTERCIDIPESGTRCQLLQRLDDSEGNPVAEFTIFSVPPSESQVKAGATIITPLETLLTQPLRLQIDAGPVKSYPYAFCSPAGCHARIGFTQGEVDALKAGAVAKVSIVPVVAPDQVVALEASLSGITAGLEALAAE